MSNPLDDYIKTKKAVSQKPSILSIISCFTTDEHLKGMFRYNEFVSDTEYTRQPVWAVDKYAGKTIDDDDECRLKVYLAKKHNLEPSTNIIHEAIVQMAHENIFHPIKEYLNNLVWDGKPRLDNWLVRATNADNNAYTQAISKKIICALVKRIFEPGCQYDYLVVFEGKQGIFKTTLVRTLGGEWYAPMILSSSDKDIVDIMRGKWILEIEDMKDFKKTEIEHIKAFLSRTQDRIRLAYRRNTRDFPRQCVIVGTINPEGNNQYLRDTTGNRRFFPIECHGKIDIDWLKKYRDQIFAEGMQTYKEEALYITGEEAKIIAIQYQEIREQSEAWQDVVFDYLKNNPQLEYITPTDLLLKAIKIPVEKLNIGFLGQIGRIMKRTDWERINYGSFHKIYYIRKGLDWKVILSDEELAQEKVLWAKEENTNA